MSIPMQGDWTVSVKSKEGFSSPQRFIISGAATGNGTYAGAAAPPPVAVTGDAWAITIQHDPGTGFVDSFDQITFPVRSGGSYRFDIQSNDDNADPLFDDLVLTCTTPVTFTDFLVYGNVSWYSGCLYNPCNPPFYLAIDSAAALADALSRPALRASIQALYPERIPHRPGPVPDPPPFKSLLLPIEGRATLPAKQAQVFNRALAGKPDHADVKSVPSAKSVASATTASVNPAVLASKTVPISQSIATSASAVLSSSALAGILGSLQFCQTGPMPQYLLRFQEYDRSPAELAGGAYTGTGPRRGLGVTTTDRNGNYIFRFSMSFFDFLDEVFNDTGVGEDPVVQALPDVIIQVLDASAPSGVLYETTPFFNIPNFRRINVCVPKDLLHLPGGCIDGQIIQSVGNITVGPLAGGTRHTANTSLDTNGVITSSSSLGPAVECAAWGGALYLYACLSEPAVNFYTISYKRPADPDTAFQFVQEDYSPYHRAPAPVYWVQQSVGPTTSSLQVDGVFRSVPSYLNIETQPPADWMDRWKLVKMLLSSSIYQNALGGPGPIVFRIQGYKTDGTAVINADDRITLYVDNNGVDQFIDPQLKMLTTAGPISQGNCALFTVPPDQPGAPLEISFRSNQNQGFMDSYQLYMDKGSTGAFGITHAEGGQFTNAYRHGASVNCNFQGTINDPVYGSPIANEVTTDVGPASGRWLDVGQPFCAFSINLTSSVRITDGQGVFGQYYSGPILIGIKAG